MSTIICLFLWCLEVSAMFYICRYCIFTWMYGCVDSMGWLLNQQYVIWCLMEVFTIFYIYLQILRFYLVQECRQFVMASKPVVCHLMFRRSIYRSMFYICRYCIFVWYGKCRQFGMASKPVVCHLVFKGNYLLCFIFADTAFLFGTAVQIVWDGF